MTSEGVRVIGYVRVSTEMQASEGVSLDAQRARLAAYCAAFGHVLVRVEADEGKSAKSLDRPGLQRALASLDAGEAGALLVVKLDRLTRSVRDLGTLLEGPFREGRHRLMSVGDQIDTHTAGGRLVLHVLMSVAQWEREAIAERVRAALRYLKSKGVRLGQMPYGCRRAERPPEGGRKPVVAVPEDTATIARAGALRAEGRTVRAVGAALAREGRSPRSGRGWSPSVVLSLAARADLPRSSWAALGGAVRVTVPLIAHAPSANGGGPLRARITGKRNARDAVAGALLALGASQRPPLPVRVSIVLGSPRAERWDHDNAVARAKPVRDAVARWLGCDDREGAGVDAWTVMTRKAPAPCVEIDIWPANLQTV